MAAIWPDYNEIKKTDIEYVLRKGKFDISVFSINKDLYNEEAYDLVGNTWLDDMTSPSTFQFAGMKIDDVNGKT